MKKRLLSMGVLFLVLAWAGMTQIPAPEVEWTRMYGGDDSDYGYSIENTADGGFIIAGQTNSFGAGQWDCYVVKTDKAGNLVWSGTYGTDRNDLARSIRQTDDKGYILVGHTDSQNYVDILLIKIDGSGNESWRNLIGGSFGDYGNSVYQTSDAGYIIGGSTSYSTGGKGDIYLVKTDSEGNVDWTQTFGDSGSDSCNAVRQTSDGGYILVGSSEKIGSVIRNDVRLIKTDSGGNLVWDKNFGDQYSPETGFSVEPTRDGGYIVAGYANVSGHSYDVYLIKTDEYGNEEWSQTAGGAKQEWGYSVLQTADGGYAACGFTKSFSASDDIYVVRWDSDGNELWTKDIDSGKFDTGYSLVQAGDGGFVIAGAAGYEGRDSSLCLVKLISENLPPVARCHDAEVAVGPDCMAVIVPEDIDAGSDDPDGDDIVLAIDGPDTFSPGVHTVTLKVTDSSKAEDSCTAEVTVIDGTPPVIADLAADPAVLWPPEHKMVPVTITATVTDNCGEVPVFRIIKVESSEPPDGLGDGDTSPDWEIVDDLQVKLRAERAGGGSGRVYSISVEALDGEGNRTEGVVTVIVPKNRGQIRK